MKQFTDHSYLKKAAEGDFYAFLQLIHHLRGENGCPWDRAQTPESIRTCMADELVETFAGIDVYRQTGKGDNLCEELGDMLLHIILIADILEEEGKFSAKDVIAGVAKKMLRRHPHVFGEESLLGWNEEQRSRHPEQLQEWAEIKKLEKEACDPKITALAKELTAMYEERIKELNKFLKMGEEQGI